MTPLDGIRKIKETFELVDRKHTIPLMKAGKSFVAYMVPKGIVCSNLEPTPLLEWEVFNVAIQLMIENGIGKPTPKGNAMAGKLGDSKLPLNSIEGKVAREVYERGFGISVFRKISAISGVLAYAGICTNDRGNLVLRNFM